MTINAQQIAKASPDIRGHGPSSQMIQLKAYAEHVATVCFKSS